MVKNKINRVIIKATGPQPKAPDLEGYTRYDIPWNDGTGENLYIWMKPDGQSQDVFIGSDENLKVVTRSRDIIFKTNTAGVVSSSQAQATLRVIQTNAVYTYRLILSVDHETLTAAGGTAKVSAQLEAKIGDDIIYTKEVNPTITLQNSVPGFSLDGSNITVANRTTTIGNPRTCTILATVNAEETGEEVFATIAITQEGNYVESISLTKGNFSYDNAVASGQVINPNSTFSSPTFTFTSGSTTAVVPSVTYGTVTRSTTYSSQASEGFSAANTETGAVTVASRGSVIGNIRTSNTITRHEYYSFVPASGYDAKGQINSELDLQATISQAANVPVSVTVVPDFTYPAGNIPASGGTKTPSIDADITITWSSGGTSTADETGESGYTLTKTPNWSMTAANGFTIDSSTGTVTAANRGTTEGDSYTSGDITLNLTVTVNITEEYGGGSISDEESVTKDDPIVQSANSRIQVFSKPTITEFTVEDIPAKGGTISSGTVTYHQASTWYYESGETAEGPSYTEGGSVQFGSAITAASLGTTVKARSVVGTLTCTVSMNGQTSVEGDAVVYQEANVRTDEGISYGSWNVSISASDFTTTSSEASAGGDSCDIIASATRTRTQNYSYTSGATSTASLADETATPEFASNGIGLTVQGILSPIAVWEDRGTETGGSRSGIITASYGGASDSVTLYQAANNVESYSSSNFDVRVNNWDCPASGGTCPLTSSIYRAPVYTSGAKGSSTKIDVTSSTSWEVTSGEYFGYISGDNLIVSSRGTDWDTSSHNIYVEGSYSGYTDSDYARVAANNRTKETSSVSVSISASKTLLSAGGESCTLSYSASYRTRYVYDSGSTTSWSTHSATPTISGSGEGFSRSGSTVTAEDRGTTTGGERSVTYTASYEGTSDQVTIRQEANEITETTYSYSNISATADDIPASGGSISSGTLHSVSCVPHYKYTSGSEDDGNTITSLGNFDVDWGTAVSASSRGTTVGDRKSVGTLTFTVSYKWGTGSGSGSVTIYQEENVANPIDEYGDITNITLTGVLNFPGKGASYQGDIMAEETIYHYIEYTSGDIVLSDTETVELDRMNANGDISSSDSWIEAVMTNTATYMITVSANPNSSSRSGTVTVTIESDESGNSASKDFTVTQKGGGVDNYLNVSPASLSFTASGGIKSIIIDTNESWTIS